MNKSRENACHHLNITRLERVKLDDALRSQEVR
jgi:hypothetical protein